MRNSPFHILAKPMGPICNLDCHYCYYLHTENLYAPKSGWRMSDERLDSFVQGYIQSQPLWMREVEFVWQGGEPTLAGIDFFRRAIKLQRRYARPGVTIRNCLQTNGTLLNKDWCQFLRQHRFLVGLSLDGPADVHDAFRVDRHGNSTHEQVIRALQLLQAERVEFNILCCVHRASESNGKRVYAFLKDHGCRFLQFIPVVERRHVGRHAEEIAPPETKFTLENAAEAVSSRSVRPKAFGEFLIDVFEEWQTSDVGKIFVQIFDESLTMWMGMEPSLCIFRRKCGQSMVIEHNGDVYSCDHFVRPEHRLGNISENSFDQMCSSPEQQKFGEAKLAGLPTYCHDCEVRFACNGECPKNRFLSTPLGDYGLNYLCEGYRLFFNHIGPAMRRMIAALGVGSLH